MAASIADNETWHVMIADDMKRMNVEQLDDAFRLSLVDASTLVWKDGMKTWQSLGAVAGLDDEPEDSVTRLRAAPSAPPPPPRPLARPAPKPPSPRSIPPAPRPPSVRPAVNPFLATAPSPFAATAPSFPPPPLVAPAYQQPQRLVAPVYTPPVAVPKRRSQMSSEVDFRRKPGGVRWGRWLVLGLLLIGGVLAAYRQNWLREGARRAGVENKYLYGERRVTAFVSAKAPPAVKNVLGKLALLPGPNAEPVVVAPKPRAPEPAVVATSPSVAAPTPTTESEPKSKSESEVKTVSLDSLPVLAESAAAKAEAPAPAVVATKPRAAVAARPSKALAKAEPKPQAEPKAKAAPKPKAEAKPKAPAPVANDNPLKAAIRSAIAADAGK